MFRHREKEKVPVTIKEFIGLFQKQFNVGDAGILNLFLK